MSSQWPIILFAPDLWVLHYHHPSISACWLEEAVSALKLLLFLDLVVNYKAGAH